MAAQPKPKAYRSRQGPWKYSVRSTDQRHKVSSVLDSFPVAASSESARPGFSCLVYNDPFQPKGVGSICHPTRGCHCDSLLAVFIDEVVLVAAFWISVAWPTMAPVSVSSFCSSLAYHGRLRRFQRSGHRVGEAGSKEGTPR